MAIKNVILLLLLLLLPLLLLLLPMFVRGLLDELLLPVVLVMLQHPLLHFAISCLPLVGGARYVGPKSASTCTGMNRHRLHDEIGIPMEACACQCDNAAETGNALWVGVETRKRLILVQGLCCENM